MLLAALFAVAVTPVSVSVIESEDAWHIAGSFGVAASHEVAWQVLTDYDHVHAFVSSMEESKVIERPRVGQVVVEQVALGKVLFFSSRMRVTLHIHEHGNAALAFEDTQHLDFFRYEGAWTIHEQDGECVVDYRLVASPRASVPKFILAPALQADARSLLSEVRAEMQRRITP